MRQDHVYPIHKDFNPLPSHEGRLDNGEFVGAQGPFQSTPLTRGETFNPASISTSGTNFNPLPSHEGRHFMRRKKRRERDFNPLPSHEGRRADGRHAALPRYFNPLPSHEGRRRILVLADSSSSFQSTPLTRGETLFVLFKSYRRNFNPLPSHEGRQAPTRSRQRPDHFNPLPSHEGRPRRAGTWRAEAHFNPLPSHEGRRR